MKIQRIQQLEKCAPSMFGDLIVTCQTPVQGVVARQAIVPIPYSVGLRRASVDSVPFAKTFVFENDQRRASALVDELLTDIYYDVHSSTDYNSTSGKSNRSFWPETVDLQNKNVTELFQILECLQTYVERMGSVLVRRLKRRDALRLQQEAYCDVTTKRLADCVPQGTSNNMRFTIQPLPGDTGFSQWVAAMKMVAQLPGGIPAEFRKRLWLTMADRHLAANGVDWPEVERNCFSEWSHPADAELGVQIVKDLHRTGCSLFCGEDGQENQALLKRVLLAYARWNKAVGYCQGFNMLAALILQVTEKCESDALKLMIYLIEGVLPDSYFADSLRGLSVDMAVFRELLRSRLPRLSKHLDQLQNAAKDGSRSYEPPLTNVFTMQWFLTLFCNCLPHPTVLRVWDLILLEGNEILLRTAIAIWQVLEQRIMNVRTADEFYCLMGALTRELLEFDLINANSLIRAIVVIGPLTELSSLREHYLYNINPWGKAVPQIVDKQLKLYPKQNIALDISALKKQYAKLKQRQRQAHIIFSAAITRQPPPAPPVAMNHLLIGKSALVPVKKVGPVPGSIPPVRQVQPSTLHWKDTPKQPSSSSSSDTELCDEESEDSSEEEEKPTKDKEEDNLHHDAANESKDVLISTADNTSSAKSSASVELDTANIQTSQTDTISNQKYESEDDSSDFEQFLADRVKNLGQPSEDITDERINFARRNSERALQIIQENSLILHRIMQCQARLSPSPPLTNTTETDTIESGSYSSPLKETDNNEMDCSEYKYLTEKIDKLKTISLKDKEPDKCLISPIYGSKYTSILEKSKSLDERYNALILNIPTSTNTIDEVTSSISSCDLQSASNFPQIPSMENKEFESSFQFSPRKFPQISSVEEKESDNNFSASNSNLSPTKTCIDEVTSSSSPHDLQSIDNFPQISPQHDVENSFQFSTSHFPQISSTENKEPGNCFQFSPSKFPQTSSVEEKDYDNNCPLSNNNLSPTKKCIDEVTSSSSYDLELTNNFSQRKHDTENILQFSTNKFPQLPSTENKGSENSFQFSTGNVATMSSVEQKYSKDNFPFLASSFSEISSLENKKLTPTKVSIDDVTSSTSSRDLQSPSSFSQIPPLIKNEVENSFQFATGHFPQISSPQNDISQESLSTSSFSHISSLKSKELSPTKALTDEVTSSIVFHDLKSTENFPQIPSLKNKEPENPYQFPTSSFPQTSPVENKESENIFPVSTSNFSEISYLQSKEPVSIKNSIDTVTSSISSDDLHSTSNFSPISSLKNKESDDYFSSAISNFSQIPSLQSKELDDNFELSPIKMDFNLDLSSASNVSRSPDLSKNYSNVFECKVEDTFEYKERSNFLTGTDENIPRYGYNTFNLKSYNQSSEDLITTSNIYSKYLLHSENVDEPLNFDVIKENVSPVDNKESLQSPSIFIDYSDNLNSTEPFEIPEYDKDQKEVISPFSEEKYKLPVIDFERFYSLASEESNDIKTIPIVPSEDIIPRKFVSDSITSEPSPIIDISDVFNSTAEATSTYDDFSSKSDGKINFDRTCGDSPVDDSKFLSASIYNSSKTCYSYLINKNIETKDYDTVLASPTSEDKSMEFTTCLDKCKSLTLDIAPNSGSPCFKSPVISPLKSLKSPSKSPLKSPSQTFNPFPVPISTRQNKEVPLKLGLYKK